MAEVKTDAIVLRHVDFGESNRMLTLLSPGPAKPSVSAPGCRRRGARLTNATEVFCAGEYMLNQRQDRYTLTGCQIKDAFYDLRCDYDRLSEGAHWLRLVETIATPNQEQPLLFALLLKGLTYLNYSKQDTRRIALTFYMHLARVGGFAPELYRCSICGQAVRPPLKLDMAGGGVSCARCGANGLALGERTLEVLRGFSTLKFAALEGVTVDEVELERAYSLMSQYIDVQTDRA